MSDSNAGNSTSLERGESPVDLLHHLQASAIGDPTGDTARRRDDPGSEASLRQALDLTQIRLLTAIDAVAGAEAERSAAEARIQELEHQHHMLKVEREELRREVERLQLACDRGGLTVSRFRSLIRRAVRALS